jgi:hypothetical protein
MTAPLSFSNLVPARPNNITHTSSISLTDDSFLHIDFKLDKALLSLDLNDLVLTESQLVVASMEPGTCTKKDRHG